MTESSLGIGWAVCALLFMPHPVAEVDSVDADGECCPRSVDGWTSSRCREFADGMHGARVASMREASRQPLVIAGWSRFCSGGGKRPAARTENDENQPAYRSLGYPRCHRLECRNAVLSQPDENSDGSSPPPTTASPLAGAISPGAGQRAIQTVAVSPERSPVTRCRSTRAWGGEEGARRSGPLTWTRSRMASRAGNPAQSVRSWP